MAVGEALTPTNQKVTAYNDSQHQRRNKEGGHETGKCRLVTQQRVNRQEQRNGQNRQSHYNYLRVNQAFGIDGKLPFTQFCALIVG